MAKRIFHTWKDLELVFKDDNWVKKLNSRVANLASSRSDFNNQKTFFVSVITTTSIFFKQSDLTVKDLFDKMALINYQYSLEDFNFPSSIFSDYDDYNKVIEVFDILINDKGLNILDAKEYIIKSFEKCSDIPFGKYLKSHGIDIDYTIIKNIASINHHDETYDIINSLFGANGNPMSNMMEQMTQMFGQIPEGFENEAKDFDNFSNDSESQIKDFIEYVKNNNLSKEQLEELLVAIFPSQFRVETYNSKLKEPVSFLDWMDVYRPTVNQPKELYSDRQNKLREAVIEKIKTLNN